MKRILALSVVLLFVTLPAFGDEVDDGLSGQAPEALKAHTREMIRAGVDSQETLRMTRAMVENRFQTANIIRAQEIVMGAVKKGLPAAPVMNKAYEGMTKGVRDRKIVQAMVRTHERYSFAYQCARKFSGNESDVQRTGNTIAEGMAAGLKNQDVDRIVERLQKRDQERTRDRIQNLACESFMTAREMVRYRVHSYMAADTVCAALERAYQARDMEMLRTSFMKNARYGSPDRLAGSYAAGIRNGALSGNLDSVGRYGSGWSSGSATGNGSGGGAGSGGQGSGGSAGSGGSGGSGAGSGRGGSGHGGSSGR